MFNETGQTVSKSTGMSEGEVWGAVVKAGPSGNASLHSHTSFVGAGLSECCCICSGLQSRLGNRDPGKRIWPRACPAPFTSSPCSAQPALPQLLDSPLLFSFTRSLARALYQRGDPEGKDRPRTLLQLPAQGLQEEGGRWRGRKHSLCPFQTPVSKALPPEPHAPYLLVCPPRTRLYAARGLARPSAVHHPGR